MTPHLAPHKKKLLIRMTTGTGLSFPFNNVLRAYSPQNARSLAETNLSQWRLTPVFLSSGESHLRNMKNSSGRQRTRTITFLTSISAPFRSWRSYNCAEKYTVTLWCCAVFCYLHSPSLFIYLLNNGLTVIERSIGGTRHSIERDRT